jgi:hypothetical protein
MQDYNKHVFNLLPFLKKKVGSWSNSVCVSPFNFWYNWQIFKKFGMNIILLGATQTLNFLILTISNNMADIQTCEVGATLNIGSWNDVQQ